MSFVETRYEHIVLDPLHVPHIAGTTMKVVELVTAQIAFGWSAEELRFQFPPLSLGQIHSALSYYWDHREDLDADIARRTDAADRQRHLLPLSSLGAPANSERALMPVGVYMDQHVPRAITAGLRLRNVDVVTALSMHINFVFRSVPASRIWR